MTLSATACVDCGREIALVPDTGRCPACHMLETSSKVKWAICNVCQQDFDSEDPAAGIWCEACCTPFWLCSMCSTAVTMAAVARLHRTLEETPHVPGQ